MYNKPIIYVTGNLFW